MSWKDYKNAPVPGTVLVQSDELVVGQPLTRIIDGFPILGVRTDRGLSVFVNACPHQYLPLDHKGDRLLSADGTTIRCTNHSAGFDVKTGEGKEGLGLGCALDVIPTEERDGAIVVADELVSGN